MFQQYLSIQYICERLQGESQISKIMLKSKQNTRSDLNEKNYREKLGKDYQEIRENCRGKLGKNCQGKLEKNYRGKLGKIIKSTSVLMC